VTRRRGLIFIVAFLFGLLCEIIGYAGRIMSWENQWDKNGFLTQIICLTIGPAFMSGGIYLCLRRIVTAFGPENSRIAPKWYTRIFIPCDVISLVLQGAGGGMASVASQQVGGDITTGDNIMIAGLVFQVFTLMIFIGCALDFAVRVMLRHRRLGASALDQSEAAVAMRQSWLFRGCLGALALSSICIFWRCGFRVAELSGGWTGPIMADQNLFIGFESVMITIACTSLNIFHPSFCFGELMDDNFRSKKNAGEIEAGLGKSERLNDLGGAVTPE